MLHRIMNRILHALFYLYAVLVALACRMGAPLLFGIQVGLIFTPLIYLGLPGAVDLLIGVAVAALFLFAPAIAFIAYAVIWIWSFILLLQAPFGLLSVLYIFSFLIFLLDIFVMQPAAHKANT